MSWVPADGAWEVTHGEECFERRETLPTPPYPTPMAAFFPSPPPTGSLGVQAHTGKGAELESMPSWPTADLYFTQVSLLLGNEEKGAGCRGVNLMAALGRITELEGQPRLHSELQAIRVV